MDICFVISGVITALLFTDTVCRESTFIHRFMPKLWYTFNLTVFASVLLLSIGLPFIPVWAFLCSVGGCLVGKTNTYTYLFLYLASSILTGLLYAVQYTNHFQ